MWPDPQETADVVTFTEGILNGKLHFLCSASCVLFLPLSSQKVTNIDVMRPFFIFRSDHSPVTQSLIFILLNIKTTVVYFRLIFKFTAWKVFKCRVLSGPYFPIFIYLPPYGFLMFSEVRKVNMGKYQPEKTPYLDTSSSIDNALSKTWRNKIPDYDRLDN